MSAVTLGVGASVALDARVSVPAAARAGGVLCHPHPLYGAAVAAAVAGATPVAGLALIAPPARIVSVTPLAVSGPVLIVIGSEDQYCPPAALEAMRGAVPSSTITVIEGADHFFVGALEALGAAVEGWAAALAP